jgi:hypothetical protein
MTATINASTTAGVVITPDNSGNIQLLYNGVAAPAFKAYLSSNQAVSANVVTKIAFNTKVYDTATCYNNTGSTVTLNGISTPSYSFAPNVPGYYLIYVCAGFGGTGNSMGLTLYKNLAVTLVNGSAVTYNVNIGGLSTLTAIAYLNGTSDYIYCSEYSPNVTQINASDESLTSFAVSLLRTS